MINDLVKKAFGSPRKPRIIDVSNVGGLTPERVKQLENQVIDIRLNGRPIGSFLQQVRKDLLENGHEAPVVIEDEKTETTTVPASFEGLLAIVASFDSLLLDEELVALRNVAGAMVPMGLNIQNDVRKQRSEREAEMEHLKAEHPEEYQQVQGVVV